MGAIWLVVLVALALPQMAAAQSFPLPPLSPRAQQAGVEVTRDEGIEFVTIRPPAVGTGGYAPIPGPGSDGRTNFGTVTQPYRIARTELTSDSYLDFLNSLGQMPENDPALQRALQVGGSNTISWQGLRDRSYPGPGFRFYLPNPETDRRIPILSINWRWSAVFCNWLHHGRTTNPQHLLSGAYDITTFGDVQTGPGTGYITDQLTRSPGARFWIPSQAEWLTAAHFDPSKTSPGSGGWWAFPTSSDTAPVVGLPTTPGAQTSAGASIGNSLSVGSYPTVQSPWGLLDTSGSGTEWVEDAIGPPGGQPVVRLFDGTSINWQGWGAFESWERPQHFWQDGAGLASYQQTLRIAAAIPSPSTAGLVLIVSMAASLRSRKG